MEVRQTLWSVFQFPSCWQVMEKPVHKSHTFSKFCELYHVNENDRKQGDYIKNGIGLSDTAVIP